MMKSMKDYELVSQISESTALEYVQRRQYEVDVLTYVLDITNANILNGTRLNVSNVIRIWSGLNEYDAGKFCLEWLCSDDCSDTLREVVQNMEKLGIEIRKPFITEGK